MQRNAFKIFLSLLSLGLGVTLPAHATMIVKLKKNTESSALTLTENHRIKYLQALDMYLVENDPNSMTDSMVNHWQQNQLIDQIEESTDIEVSHRPRDPLSRSQDTALSPSHWDEQLDKAWDVSIGDQNIVVAVLDTGIDIHHEDLRANIWVNTREIPDNHIDDDQDGYVDDVFGYNFFDQNNDISDENMHGTHIAGIIGARGDNNIGIAGIAWRVKLMPLKFTDRTGAGSTSRAIEGINYAIEHGANIINASWTMNNSANSDLLREAIKKAGQAGILFVTASGNRFTPDHGINLDETPIYPACFHEKTLLAVAALDIDGTLAPYSNYGKQCVTLAAPGTNIFSTLPNNRYGTDSGTSMATAFVSGTSALMLSTNLRLTPNDIKKILSDHADKDLKSDQEKENEKTASGNLNISTAVSASKEFVAIEGGGISSDLTSTPEPQANNDSSLNTGNTESAGGCSLNQE